MPRIRFESLVAVVLAGAVGGAALAAPVLSQEKTGTQILGDRQKAMRDMQIPNGYFQLQSRSANPDFATIATQAPVMKAALELSKVSFPPHTKNGGDVEGAHVRARDSVWTEWEQVSAMFDRAIKASDDVGIAAAAKDKDAFVAAARALNTACSDCHVKYRE